MNRPILVIAADMNQEWILPWWWFHFNAFSQNVDVIIADLGMSQSARRFCEHHTHVINVGKHEITWNTKPTALLTVLDQTDSQIIAWMDLDCEIRGPLDYVFKATSQIGLHVTLDNHNLETGKPILGDGFCVFNRAHHMIETWYEKCQEIEYSQSALQATADEYDTVLTHFMNPMFHAYRLDGTDQPALVFHWTGKQGKEAIRCQIKAQS